MAAPALHLGASIALDGAGELRQRHLPAHHLVTHGVVVGMTGSGKTGLLTVAVEEVLRALVVFDEVFGCTRPTPPPSARWWP